jgi:hypothetical protein
VNFGFGHPDAPFGDRALQVPTFRRGVDPAFVRAELLRYYRLHDVAVAVRADLLARRAKLQDLWGAGCLVRYYEACIQACAAWLKATARCGGRGLPPLSSGGVSRSVKGAQRRSEPLTVADSACLSRGLGGSLTAAKPMATVQQTEGRACDAASGSDITVPANPVFLASGVQELQSPHFKPQEA